MKKDKIQKLYFSDIGSQINIDRREFLKSLGGGIIIIFSIGELSVLGGGILTKAQESSDFNAYLRVKEDGRIDCYTGKIEMGQGVITSLAQVLADELEVSLDQVDMVMGDTELCPYDAGTWGSLTTRFFDPILRAAAAEARAVLIELAAEHLQISKKQLKASEGVIYDTKNEKTQVTYAQLTKDKKIVKPLSEKPPVKTPSEFKIIGKPELRTDALAKVTGEAKYAGDIRLPGMLYAKILRPPAHGARLISLDASALENIEGIEVVREKDFFAVLHKSTEIAEEAINKVKAEYEVPEPKANDETIFKHLLSVASESNLVEEGGNLKEGRELSDITVEEEYLDGYVAHAPIETHTATAKFEGDKITMWVSSQTPFGTRQAISETLNMPLQKVHIKQNFLGGGFGSKNYNQQAIEAARIAKLSGKPVQLVWTRGEEFFYDMFRPAAVVKINTGITNSGKITLWDYSVYFAGARGSQLFYDIPHNRTMAYDSAEGAHPFGTGAWRAPANNTNTFARESQIDIMAWKAGVDPFEFRLNNMKDEKMIRVLKAAAKKFGWTPIKLPGGKGYGIACGVDAGSYVAQIAEVEVDKKTGQVQVKRVVCAQDMGQVVNPQGAILQIEGCITMGLGYALTEDVKFNWGEVKTRNFDTYEITRFSRTPKIDTVLIDAQDSPPQGGGEPPIICVGGVIANAIFDATGARLFQLPMTPERILEAIHKG
ncbi:Nicotinate dehydrogenase subunit B [subsurface metagenome]